MVILDNFEKYGRRKPHYGSKRMLGILGGMEERWPAGVSVPTVLVGSRTASGIEIATYRTSLDSDGLDPERHGNNTLKTLSTKTFRGSG